MIVYSFLLKSSQYLAWMLPINAESRNQKRIMLIWYLVPRNKTKELCNVTKLILVSNQLKKVISRLHLISKHFHWMNERSLIATNPSHSISTNRASCDTSTSKSELSLWVICYEGVVNILLLTLWAHNPKPQLVAQMNHRLKMPGNPKKGSTFCSGASMASSLHFFVGLKSKQ